MDISKELQKNQTILLIMPSADYSRDIISVMKKLKGNICYVTLNKTFDALKEDFKKNKIKTDNIVFIDAISKTIRQVPDTTEGCYFISSPGSLTEISIAIDRFLRHNFDYIIFDSLTNMLIYEKKAPVAKFVSSLVNKIRATKTKAIFYALSVQEQQALIAETGMFVDKVVNL
jgi:archaellum biogenesis ATPase FlaH